MEEPISSISHGRNIKEDYLVII